jgi:hypothetical protein
MLTVPFSHLQWFYQTQQKCWQEKPEARPDFAQLASELKRYA